MIFNQTTPDNHQEKWVKGCSRWGFFAEFMWTLNHLEWCLTQNKIPVVYWDNASPYYEPEGYNGSTNAWEYYFEPVSKLSYEPGDTIHRTVAGPDQFRVNYGYNHYIRNENEPTKEFRKWVKEQLINRYIKIKKPIKKKMDFFYKNNMKDKKTVGIHLRGKHLFNEIKPVPLSRIFSEANQYAEEGYQFFVATDQKKLLEEAKKNLKGKVIYYDCYRSDEGPTFAPIQSITEELAHQSHISQFTGFLGKVNYNKAKLGEEVLIEILLLSLCNKFICTISNVSLAVLYFNPDLEYTRLHISLTK